MAKVILVSEIETGEIIEVQPKVTFSSERDTEPGAQPWLTEFIRYDKETDKIMVPCGEYFKKDYPNGERPIDSAAVKFVDRAGAFGSRNARYKIDVS